jgi:RNA polymerase-binding transcription factor DksA
LNCERVIVKLIAKIDAALKRLEESTYGYCKSPTQKPMRGQGA